MDFSEYLVSKKIEETSFREGDPDRYKEFKELFVTMHPKSFTMQKLFLINGIRRQYPLPAKVASATKKAPAPRPKIPKRKSSSPAADTGKKESADRAKTSSGKPLLKPRPLKPKISGTDNKGDKSSGKNKPARPVMKPKMPSSKKSEDQAGGREEKPVKRARPVMKPKIPAKPEQDAQDKKPNRPKPLIKPRIPTNKKDSGEEEKLPKASKEDKGSKKKSKPIIKPRKKND